MAPQRIQTAAAACCVVGPPGSGKSTFGRALAARLTATLLDLDVATNPLLAEIARLTGAGDDLDHPNLSGRIRNARYRCLIDLAADNLRLGRSIVLVAPFTAEVRDAATWKRTGELLHPATPWLIWVQVPIEVALARRRSRGLPRDRAANLLVARYTPSPEADHLVVDGLLDPTLEAERIAKQIGRR